MSKPALLELFAGTGSIGKAARQLGFDVFSSDFDEKFDVDYCTDIMDFQFADVTLQPNVIWASPPCTTFSIASVSHHWNKDRTPKTDAAFNGKAIVEKTLRIIDHYQPEYWFIENPRGMLRKMPFMQNMVRHTVTYCQYGDTRMKPTDIWTNNLDWQPRPMCKNGMPCHQSAPRGSSTGTQGVKGKADRSRIPHELCIEIMQSCLTATKDSKEEGDQA